MKNNGHSDKIKLFFFFGAFQKALLFPLLWLCPHNGSALSFIETHLVWGKLLTPHTNECVLLKWSTGLAWA